MATVASAAPQYGHSNYFSGYKKPLQKPEYKRCKVVWKEVNKAGYKEVKEEKCDLSPTKYLFKIPKPSVKLDMKRDAKTNGSALIIPNKTTSITVKTKNGNQQMKVARAFMWTNAEMNLSPDMRIVQRRNAEPFINKSPLKSPERSPSENALEKLPMNTLPLKSENTTSLVIRFL